MGKIQELLEEILIQQLEEIKTNKTVPSREVLDTIDLLHKVTYMR